MTRFDNSAQGLLASYGFDPPSDERQEATGESYEDQEEVLIETLGHALNEVFGMGESTGGADWSSTYVWRVPKRLESIVTLHRPGLRSRAGAPQGAFYLIWDEGDLFEELYFIDAWTDEDDNTETEEIDVVLTPALMRELRAAVGRDPDHIEPWSPRLSTRRAHRR